MKFRIEKRNKHIRPWVVITEHRKNLFIDSFICFNDCIKFIYRIYGTMN